MIAIPSQGIVQHSSETNLPSETFLFQHQATRNSSSCVFQFLDLCETPEWLFEICFDPND